MLRSHRQWILLISTPTGVGAGCCTSGPLSYSMADSRSAVYRRAFDWCLRLRTVYDGVPNVRTTAALSADYSALRAWMHTCGRPLAHNATGSPNSAWHPLDAGMSSWRQFRVVQSSQDAMIMAHRHGGKAAGARRVHRASLDALQEVLIGLAQLCCYTENDSGH